MKLAAARDEIGAYAGFNECLVDRWVENEYLGDRWVEDVCVLCYYHSILKRGRGTLVGKRLAGYDYSQPGYYFVTICTQYRRAVFGTITNGEVYLKEPGYIAQSVWIALPRRFVHVRLHEYVFMPNHMHAILELTDAQPTHTDHRATLGQIIRAFKAATSYKVRHSENKIWFAWQDDYHDEMIRDETMLQNIRRYIFENPMRWSQDKFYQRY